MSRDEEHLRHRDTTNNEPIAKSVYAANWKPPDEMERGAAADGIGGAT